MRLTPRLRARSGRRGWAFGVAATIAAGASWVGIASAAGGAVPGDGALILVPLPNPCRIFDTRPDYNVPGVPKEPIGPDGKLVVSGRGNIGECALPDFAQGLQLNVTGVDASNPTWVALYPDGQERPNASNLNLVPGGAPTPNAVTVKLSADGKFVVFNRFGTVHVLADVVGVWVESDSRYYTEPEIDAMLTNLIPSDQLQDLIDSLDDEFVTEDELAAALEDYYTKDQIDALLQQAGQGCTILSGAVAPAANLGKVCDLYLDTVAMRMYGPKTAQGWGAGKLLIGANGAPGAAGTNGTNGTNGMSAFDIAVEGGFGGTVDEWLESLKGAPGEDGGIFVIGDSPVLSGDGPPAADLGEPGDLYIDESTGDLYVNVDGVWEGPQANLMGPEGPEGPQGADGLSAFDLWLIENPGGTLEEFFEALVGPEGAQGLPGLQGADGLSAFDLWLIDNPGGTMAEFFEALVGPEGPQGPQGEDGLSAFDLWLIENPGGTIEEFFEAIVGPEGAAGSSAYEVAVSNGFAGTEAEWLLTLIGEQGPQGPQGEDGGIFVIGDNPVLSGDGPPPADLGEPGDLYIDESTGDLYVNVDGVWEGPQANLMGPAGPQGEKGDQGDPGQDGLSAFDVWLIDNPGGTVEEFFEALVGPPGPQGEQGFEGKSAYQIAVEVENFVGDESVWLESLQGEDGEDGGVFVLGGNDEVLTGDGPPAANLGADGDLYLDLLSGDLYVKVNGAWDGPQANLMGPQGPQGEPGEDGGVFIIGGDDEVLTGEGPPAANLGADGDLYLDQLTGDLYVKVNGAWEGPKANLTGPDGPAGPQGPAGSVIHSGAFVDPAIGNVGDYFFLPEKAYLFGPKTDQGWPEDFIELRGQDGAPGAPGSRILSGGEPDPNAGAVGDYWLYVDKGLLFGPKTVGGWTGTPISLMGTDGQDGTRIYSGPAAPASSLGRAGDFYLEKTPNDVWLWGPKGGIGVNWDVATRVALNGVDGETPASLSDLGAVKARVLANGQGLWSSLITGVSHPKTGSYCVTFDGAEVIAGLLALTVTPVSDNGTDQITAFVGNTGCNGNNSRSVQLFRTTVSCNGENGELIDVLTDAGNLPTQYHVDVSQCVSYLVQKEPFDSAFDLVGF